MRSAFHFIVTPAVVVAPSLGRGIPEVNVIIETARPVPNTGLIIDYVVPRRVLLVQDVISR